MTRNCQCFFVFSVATIFDLTEIYGKEKSHKVYFQRFSDIVMLVVSKHFFTLKTSSSVDHKMSVSAEIYQITLNIKGFCHQENIYKDQSLQ